MDNLLIALDSSASGFWLAYHAVNLHRRVKVNIFILMVTDEEHMLDSGDENEWIGACENCLESLLTEECSKHTHFNYYTVNGEFEQKILEFVRGNDITILVLGQPPAGNSKKVTHFLEMLENISRQTSCRIEVAQKIWGCKEDDGGPRM
jgi:K+-sensing histidine kinase KdpD